MNLQGTIYRFQVQRIPVGQDYSESVSASNGTISGPDFCIGIAHNDDGNPTYLAIQNGAVVAQGDALDAVASKVVKLLKAVIPVTSDEASDLVTIFSADDETEWDLDEDEWMYRIGWGGEVPDADSSFDGGLAVSFSVVENTAISVAGYGEPDPDDDYSDRSEFGGLRRPSKG